MMQLMRKRSRSATTPKDFDTIEAQDFDTVYKEPMTQTKSATPYLAPGSVGDV